MARFTYTVCESCLKPNKISLDKAQSKAPVCGQCGRALDVHGAIVNLSTKSLQKLIQVSPLPVIIDFWASWCAPCRAFAPSFARVADELAGRAVFVKVDTERDMTASQVFGIRGIPLVVAYADGNEIGRQAGALPYDAFKRMAEQLVAKQTAQV